MHRRIVGSSVVPSAVDGFSMTNVAKGPSPHRRDSHHR
jgi:hypothetical protein